MAEQNVVDMTLRVSAQGLELIDSTGKKVGELGRTAVEAGNQASASWAKIAAGAGVIAAVGAAALTAKAGFDAFFAGVERGSQLNDLAQRVGVSVEQLSRLELAARTNGVSLDELGVGIQQLSRKMTEAASGGKDAQAAFAAVGISAKDLGSLNTDQVLARIADKFAATQDGATKTALAMDLAGRAGAGLIPLFNEGSAGLQRWSDLSEKLGLTMTTQLAQSFDSIGDSADALKMAVTGAQNQFAIGMAPALEQVSAEIIDFVANVGIADGGLRDLGASVGELIRGAVDPAIDGLKNFVETARLDGFGVAAEQALGDAEDVLKAKALELGHAIGTAISAGIEENILVDAEAILKKIPLIGTIAKIREAFHAATSAPDFDTGAVPFADIEAGWAKQARAIDSASAALDRNAAVSRTTAGAYVMLGGDAAIAAAAVDKGTLSYQKGGDAAGKMGEDLAHAAAALGATGAIYDLAAKGSISLAEANLRAAAASAVLGKGVTDEKALMAALAVERQKAAVEATKEAAAAVEAANASQRRVDILDDAIAAGLSNAEAEQLLAQATIEAHAADILATTGSEQKAEQYRQAAEAARANAQAEKDRQAVLQAQNRTQDMQLELSLTQQVNQGLITELDKKIQIARAQADGNDALADQLEKQVRIQDAIEDQQTAYLHLGDVFKDSFNQAFDAVISGTRDMGDVLEGIGIGIGKRFFSAMLESKLKDFDPTVKANFLELGDYGQGIFSKLFSGGSEIGSSGGSGGGLFKQAADWIGGLFEGSNAVDYTGVGSLGYSGAAAGDYANGAPFGSIGADPPNYVELSSGGQDFTGGGSSSGGGFGAGAANAAAGAVTAYSLFQATDDTKLEGLIAKGTESGVLNASNAIGQVVGTIVGAVASIYLGPLGGVLGGVVGSGFSALIAGSVTRDTFLKGEYSGFMGVGQNAFNPGKLSTSFLAGIPLAQEAAWTSYKLFDAILNLPSLGLAMRKGGESLLDNSETFKGAQARFGDITVRSGGPRDVYRNNLTGSDTARERGFTDAQVDLTKGATSAIFGQLTEGELGQDAGRLGEAMGNIMAEFLSRGLKDGIDFEPMFDLLRQFAHEAGVDVLTSLRSLDDVMADSISAAQTWGKLDPMAAATQGARAYAEALVGATTVFEKDYPQGVHLTAIALRNMEKDGVNAFGEIDSKAKDTLFNLSKDTELTTDVIAKLVEQGFTINTDEFERQLSAISQSAALIGQNIGDVFNFNDAGAGLESIFSNLKSQIYDVFSKESIKQLFDTTNIASAFEPVFAVLDRIDEFDLTTAQGSQDFMGQLLPAIAEGKANLQEYIPILQVMADNWKEIQKIIDDAMKPDVFEQAAQIAEEGFNGIGGALNDAISAGLAVLEDGGTWDQAVNVFNGTFGAGVEKSFKDAIFNAIVQSAIIQPLIATYQPAFAYVVAAGMIHGFDDPRVKQAFGILMNDVTSRAKDLGLLVFTAKVDSDGITSGIEKAFNDAADITVDWADNLTNLVHTGLNAAFDVLASGGTRDAALAAWGDALGANTRDAVFRGIVLALIDAAIIKPFIDQWAPAIQFWTAGAIAKGVDDPKVKQAAELLFGPNSPFMQGLNNLGPISIDFYGRIIGYTDENGNSIDVDSAHPGSGGSSNGRGTGPGPGGGTPVGPTTHGFAGGGSIAHGASFIVGERGPELVITNASGSTIIPLDVATANQMLGGGLAGYADGTLPPQIDRHRRTNPGPGGLGPLGRPRVPPPPGQHPGTTGVGTVDVQVDLNLDDAVEAFLRGGSLKDFQDALDEATKKAVLDGVIKGMLESGPIKNAIDAFNKQMDDAVTKAMRDGVIDGQEQASLDALAEKLSGGIETATKSMQPVVESLGKAFGLGVEQSTKEAIDGISSDLDGAIRTFLEGGSVEDMSDAINRSVYDSTTGAIIKALLTTGPLASVIDKFGSKVGDAISDALDDGTIDEKEARRIRRIGKKYGGEISEAIKALGPVLGPLFEDWAGQLGLDLKGEIVSVEGLLGNAVRQGLLDGSSFGTFQQNVKQALYEAIVDGMVQAFIDSAVINGLLAGPLGVINSTFAQIADGQLTVAEANKIIFQQVGVITGLINSPAFKAAWDVMTSGIDAIRASLGIATNNVVQAAQGFNDVADAANNACAGECEWEKKLVEGQEKNATLSEYGRQGYEAVETYGPVKPGDGSPHDPWDDVPDTLGGGNGVYGHPSDLIGYWQRREMRKNRRRGRHHDRHDVMGGPGSFDGGSGDWSRPDWHPSDDRDFVGPNAAAHSGPMLVQDEGVAALRAEVASLRDAILNMPPPVVNLDGREISKNSRKHERRESRGAQSTQWGIS